MKNLNTFFLKLKKIFNFLFLSPKIELTNMRDSITSNLLIFWRIWVWPFKLQAHNPITWIYFYIVKKFLLVERKYNLHFKNKTNIIFLKIRNSKELTRVCISIRACDLIQYKVKNFTRVWPLNTKEWFFRIGCWVSPSHTYPTLSIKVVIAKL